VSGPGAFNDVRRANRSSPSALGISPTKDEHAEFVSILDPDSEGYASFESFFAICALKFHQRDEDDSDDKTHRAELEEAFGLFTQGSGAGTITLTHLKRVAALLKEEVAEELLRDMIQEANGGAGVSAGVRREEFDDVMRRAGVWR
jgi:hydroxyacylglutathione hydrolase